MPTMTLLPTGSTAVGLPIGQGWTVTVPAGDALFHLALRSDDDDTSYASSDGTDDGYFTITSFESPSVAVGSITSVQYLTSGKRDGRSRFTSNCEFELTVPAGDVEGEAYSTAYSAENGPIETERPGGGAWTYSDLENFQMKVIKANTVALRLSYLVLKVTYVKPNAVFFGTNF